MVNNRFLDAAETVTVGGTSSVVTNRYTDPDGLLTEAEPTGFPTLVSHHRQVDGQLDSTQVGGIAESRD